MGVHAGATARVRPLAERRLTHRGHRCDLHGASSRPITCDSDPPQRHAVRHPPEPPSEHRSGLLLGADGRGPASRVGVSVRPVRGRKELTSACQAGAASAAVTEFNDVLHPRRRACDQFAWVNLSPAGRSDHIRSRQVSSAPTGARAIERDMERTEKSDGKISQTFDEPQIPVGGVDRVRVLGEALDKLGEPTVVDHGVAAMLR